MFGRFVWVSKKVDMGRIQGLYGVYIGCTWG